MSKESVLTQEDFDALLQWFSPNREEAGLKYEEIRSGLIRYFNFKGCPEAEILADETINRVAKKFSTFDTNNTNKHITYFYGFASKIYLEFRTKNEKRTVEFEQNLHANEVISDPSENIEETRHQCLEECLDKLSTDEKKFVIHYFSKEKSEKIEYRRQLAKVMNLSMGTMHVRIYRLKTVLKDCVENCLGKNSV